jgi:hypothetical protein
MVRAKRIRNEIAMPAAVVVAAAATTTTTMMMVMVVVMMTASCRRVRVRLGPGNHWRRRVWAQAAA